MKSVKILLATAAICLGMMPQLPAMAANGEIACDSLIRDNGYSVVRKRGGEPVYNRNGRIVNYTYVYNVRNNNRRDRRDRVDRRDRRDVVTCVWNARRDSARLIYR